MLELLLREPEKVLSLRDTARTESDPMKLLKRSIERVCRRQLRRGTLTEKQRDAVRAVLKDQLGMSMSRLPKRRRVCSEIEHYKSLMMNLVLNNGVNYLNLL